MTAPVPKPMVCVAGAPGAVQVADRWHLLCNGSQALVQVLDRRRGEFSRVARTIVSRSGSAAGRTPSGYQSAAATAAGSGGSGSPLPARCSPGSGRQGHPRHRARDRSVAERGAALAAGRYGADLAQRRAGVDHRSVRPLPRAAARRRRTQCDAAVARVAGLGLLGWRDESPALRGCSQGRPAADAICPCPVWRRPSPRRTARLLLTGGEHGELDGRFLDALVAAFPEIERALAEVKAFTVIVREQDQAGFGAWLDPVAMAR